MSKLKLYATFIPYLNDDFPNEKAQEIYDDLLMSVHLSIEQHIHRPTGIKLLNILDTKFKIDKYLPIIEFPSNHISHIWEDYTLLEIKKIKKHYNLKFAKYVNIAKKLIRYNYDKYKIMLEFIDYDTFPKEILVNFYKSKKITRNKYTFKHYKIPWTIQNHYLYPWKKNVQSYLMMYKNFPQKY